MCSVILSPGKPIRDLEYFRIQEAMDSKLTKMLKSNIFLGARYITNNCFGQGYRGIGERTSEGTTDLASTLLIITINDSLL